MFEFECSYLGHLTRNWYTHPLDQQCVSFGGLYDGETVCFVPLYKSSSASTVYKAFGFPSYSPTVHLIQSIRISLIKGSIHYYTSPTTSLSSVAVQTFSSCVSLSSDCAVTMDNLHHLTRCSGQFS